MRTKIWPCRGLPCSSRASRAPRPSASSVRRLRCLTAIRPGTHCIAPKPAVDGDNWASGIEDEYFAYSPAASGTCRVSATQRDTIITVYNECGRWGARQPLAFQNSEVSCSHPRLPEIACDAGDERDTTSPAGAAPVGQLGVHAGLEVPPLLERRVCAGQALLLREPLVRWRRQAGGVAAAEPAQLAGARQGRRREASARGGHAERRAEPRCDGGCGCWAAPGQMRHHRRVGRVAVVRGATGLEKVPALEVPGGKRHRAANG